MSRDLHSIEKGLRIYNENADTFVDILQGSSAPDGLGDQSTAEIGSLYIRRGTGELYQKIANAGNSSDWQLNGSGSSSLVPIFRNIVVRAATNDTVAAGTVDPTGFSDNESGLDGNDFAVGEYLIGDVDGTPALFEITAVNAANDITVAAASPGLVDNDGFVVRAYLPDSPASQENQALVVFQNGSIIKLADVDWNFATGISISSGYTPINGTVGPSDSVESSIEKLDGNQQDLTSLSGVSQGSTDLGAFTGTTIPDGQTIKQAIQAQETAYEETDANVDDLITLSGVAENSTDLGASSVNGDVVSDNATIKQAVDELDDELTRQNGQSSQSGVTAITTVDSVLVDEVASVEWLVTVENAASPANKKHYIVYAGHDGHAAADATGSDDSVFARLRQGANFNDSITVDVNGAGAAQVLRLRVTSTEPSGVNVYAKRVENRF